MIASRELKVSEAVDKFLEDRARYYDTGEGPTRQLANVRSGLTRWLVPAMGDRWLYELTGPALDALMVSWTETGSLGRTYVNRLHSYTVQLMKFCVRKGYAVPEQLVSVQAVEKIRRGRYGLTDPEPVRPVTTGRVEAVLPALNPVLASTVRLMLLTGMRPGEARIMRAQWLREFDTETGEPGFLYVPRRHKTAHLGKRRAIPIVGEAHALVAERLRSLPAPDTEADYLFSPAGDGARPYSADRLGRVLHRLCAQAGVEAWRPNQLRHRYATLAWARGLTLDAVSQLMGHTDTRTTLIYAEPDDRRAIDSARVLAVN